MLQKHWTLMHRMIASHLVHHPCKLREELPPIFPHLPQGVLHEVLLPLQSISPLLIRRLQVGHQLILLRWTLPWPRCLIGHWSWTQSIRRRGRGARGPHWWGSSCEWGWRCCAGGRHSWGSPVLWHWCGGTVRPTQCVRSTYHHTMSIARKDRWVNIMMPPQQLFHLL